MAVTEEFKQDVLEVLDEYTAQLENQSGQNATPVMPAEDADKTVSMPAVKFDVDPRTSSRAKPIGYYQIPVADFFDIVEAAAAAVEQETADLADLKERIEQARQAAINATGEALAATDGAERVNATLVGMTITITDRNGDSRQTDIGFDIYNTYATRTAMMADAANVPKGKFVMIATDKGVDPTQPIGPDNPPDPDNATLWGRNAYAADDPDPEHLPFTFLSDLDQASSSAWADWMENWKPIIEADHATAQSDHTTAGTDHTRAESDHTRAESDHTRAESDHTRADGDHTTAGQDHTQAGNDHTRAENDHTRAENDHTRSEQDHTRSENDHLQYTTDNQTAADDHQTAQLDHQTAGEDHQQAGEDHEASEEATDAANTQAARAKGYNDHPWQIGNDGHIYVWDEQTQAMVQTTKVIIDFNDLTPEQQAAMVQEFISHLTFDETPTSGSPNAVTSRGIRAALDLKQDVLTFATETLCQTAAQDVVFS